jgi:hypothetical protein
MAANSGSHCPENSERRIARQTAGTESKAMADTWRLVLTILMAYAVLVGSPGESMAADTAMDGGAPDSANAKDASLADRLKLSGSFEDELRWNRDHSFQHAANRTTSDLYVRMVEIALESPLAEDVSSTVVINSEWLNDFVNCGDQQIAIDEVHIDFQTAQTGPYAVFGKRSQPFGVFENQLISDPLAMNAYETNIVGMTVGFQSGSAVDVSLTLYKGVELMNHLFQSRLFDTSKVTRVQDTVTQVGSWIAAGIFSTADSSMTLVSAVLSEPGRDRRNLSAQLATNIQVPWARNISIDAEYIKALRRERYVGADRDFREGVIGITVAYSFVYRSSQFTSRGLYRARRSFIRSHPFTTALRYEHFYDDGLAVSLSSPVTASKYSVAARYTILERFGTIAYIAGEYSHTTCRVPTGTRDPAIDYNDTFLARFGVDF